ncbi:MAG: flagellar type III secretion system pore protein FliP [Gammaproteobacteria bacterium]|jgi:flagellar biosynthesis protein FliP|nr:flagellar type III secretion system pore protein FliP [Gammaproteobacteria bacterium]MBT4607299.1 flagellar type III secretion system pore protein FliP [Thiotrichales bacterium]MBT3473856.1 flagellar type III secretion system pore protein FliP [Gammaproteobacteria bacterium]MBT3892540.1 flagellar type III secretion system pore protein FliP [Gammaproteobacteria bacterium]MBT4331116.1 flagellar type III secretion system pore protein FliP [Gammaproteobacteria bacterium]
MNWQRIHPRRLLLLFVVLVAPVSAWAAGIPALTLSEDGGTYTLSLQILIMMTLLTLLPAAFMTMTSFLRIVIVLSLLRQAMGTMQSPNNQIIIGLAMFMTFFIMAPTFNQAYQDALEPLMAEEIGMEVALQKAAVPFRAFMMRQVREDDLAFFGEMAGVESYEDEASVPFSVLLPSYVTSELKTAFQIGFLIFIPFLIIDIVVASLLMSMGMMMLSPMIISLPFKIMLFVLVDGWTLVLGTLASSFLVR